MPVLASLDAHNNHKWLYLQTISRSLLNGPAVHRHHTPKRTTPSEFFLSIVHFCSKPATLVDSLEIFP